MLLSDPRLQTMLPTLNRRYGYDRVQQALLRVWRSKGDLDVNLTYLTKACIYRKPRLTADPLDKPRAKEKLDDNGIPSNPIDDQASRSPSPETSALIAELRSRVNSTDWQLLSDHAVHGINYAELARERGQTAEAIRKRIRNIKQKLNGKRGVK